MKGGGETSRRSRRRRGAIVAGAVGVLTAALAASAVARPANEDFRISRSGGIGPPNPAQPAITGEATDPAIAYNPIADEYLVAWESDDPDAGLSTSLGFNEFEIFAQRLDADGRELGANDFLVSDAGGINEDLADASNPTVAFNTVANQYLVAWQADDTDTPGIVDDEEEIFGQLLNAAGNEVAPNDFRISDAGGTGDSDFLATQPVVTHNPAANEYLVAWQAEDVEVGGAFVDGEREIFAQRLDAAGGEVGDNDFRLSDAGGSGDNDPIANSPAAAYNRSANEYLVAWHADDTDAGLADDENEVFAQRVSPLGGELGANDFRVSDAGGTGNDDLDAEDPAIAVNPAGNEYLVDWEADDTDAAGVVDGENEIFAQRLDAAGTEVGTNDARISDTGGSGDGSRDAENPIAAYRSDGDEYLLAWQADDPDTGLQDSEEEVHARRFVRPLNVAVPEISGAASVGGVLNCSNGGWVFGPDAFTHQWRRAGAGIPGATNAAYIVTTADAGKTISCRVTATNYAGSRTADSAAVVPSRPGELLVLISLNGKLTVGQGKRIKVPFASTLAGSAMLEVIRLQGKRGKAAVKSKRRSLVATITGGVSEGRNTIVWSAKRGKPGRKRPAKPGGYKLRLTVTAGDGQQQTDVARLRIRKKKR